MPTVSSEVTAARERFLSTGIPFFTRADRQGYLCAFCGEEIPDGNHVAAVVDRNGRLTGVVASADPNPYTAANFTHRCGKGTTTVPEEIAHHDREHPAAAAMRRAEGAPA